MERNDYKLLDSADMSRVVMYDDKIMLSGQRIPAYVYGLSFRTLRLFRDNGNGFLQNFEGAKLAAAAMYSSTRAEIRSTPGIDPYYWMVWSTQTKNQTPPVYQRYDIDIRLPFYTIEIPQWALDLGYDVITHAKMSLIPNAFGPNFSFTGQARFFAFADRAGGDFDANFISAIKYENSCTAIPYGLIRPIGNMKTSAVKNKIALIPDLFYPNMPVSAYLYENLSGTNNYTYRWTKGPFDIPILQAVCYFQKSAVLDAQGVDY